MSIDKSMIYIFSVLFGLVIGLRLSKECLNEPCIINV